MPEDINNLDTKDEGLQAIFGDRFQDMTVAESCTARKNQPSANTTQPKKAAQKPKDEPAKWNPAKPAPDWMDRLKACVVWAVGFGSLNFLIFYWQLAGLMDDSIAIPCMWVCMALAGFGVGKNAFGRVR
jgi:hypothetical protein